MSLQKNKERKMYMFYLPEGWLIDSPQNQLYFSSCEAFEKAMRSEVILEGRVSLCDAQHNLHIDLPFGKGIIARNEGALGIGEGVRDIALISRVNKPVCFTLESIDFENGEPLYHLSRKKAQRLCLDNYIMRKIPGDVIDARVTHLEPFGAFCDIGCGIVSLIPIDCISVSRIFHPRDRFFVGEDIRAVIRAVEPNGRVHLTHKELLGTWEENAAMLSPGETVSGIIRTVESYGCFIELSPNLAGLAEPKEDVYPCQQASVFVKSIIPEKMKIKLIIIDAFDSFYAKPAQKYFDLSDHITQWCYSPPQCQRYIGTQF